MSKLSKENTCKAEPFVRSVLGTIELKEPPKKILLNLLVAFESLCQMILHLQQCHRVTLSHSRLSSTRSLFARTKAALFVSAVLIPSVHSPRPALLHDGRKTELSDPSPSISLLSEVMRWPAPRSGNSLVR